jgi:CHASE2 domain-containing sensor protein
MNEPAFGLIGPARVCFADRGAGKNPLSARDVQNNMRASESRYSATVLIEPMLPTSRWGNAGLVVGIAVALGVWVLHQAGWLEGWDGMFYDRLHAFTTHWRDPKPQVLLLRLEREDAWSDADAIKTLEVLEGLGARAIAVDFVPYRNSREFFQRVAELKNVVFGRELRPDPDNPDNLRLEAWPAAARDLDLPWGVVCLPSSLRGVHRWQQTHVTAGKEAFPTLEQRAAAYDPTAAKSAVRGPFLINFVGGPGTIPNVSLSRVLAGELVAEMVKGKIVLVDRDERFLGLETPVCGGDEPMTFLEFQGNALQTLLDGNPIRPLPWYSMLLLLVSLGITSSLLYQRVGSVTRAREGLGVLLICVLAAVVGMGYFRYWLALGPIVLAQTGQFVLTLVFRTRRTRLTLNDLRLRTLSQIEERFCPQNILHSPEFWDHLGSMINQTLEVERMVFFERVPETQKLQEIKVFNCTFESIRRTERELDAMVFATALAAGHPVRVTGFFDGGKAPEQEYLCPLIFDGEVMGMWVVCIQVARLQTIPQFEIILTKFSQQIARSLYHKKRAPVKRTLIGRLKSWFATDREDPLYRELRSLADLLEQYYDVLDTVFSQISTATIVYDSFGRVLKANELAFTLLQPENFVPTRGTALDFIRLVTGKDESQVRDLLREVFLERSPASMSVKLASQGDRQFLLRLYPMPEPAQPRPGSETASAQGIVCELIETTSLSTLASLKGVVADRLGVELRNHLAAIKISTALLEADPSTSPERQVLLEAIHHKINICVLVISECQKYLGRDVDAHAIRCFPIDSLEVLAKVCSELAQKAAERRVAFKIQQPQLMAQVLASGDLARLFSAVVELLLMDAAENTAVAIDIDDVPNTASFRFSNSGFGIPNDRLQEILNGPELPDSPEFQVLREAAAWVRAWEGNFEIASDVGKGYSIVLRLRQFPVTQSSPQPPSSLLSNQAT